LTGPTALVVAAGNTFLDNLHGTIREADFDDNDFDHNATEFPWRIQPNDRTPSYLELVIMAPTEPEVCDTNTKAWITEPDLSRKRPDEARMPAGAITPTP
jgi:hypothetical protein